MRADDWIALKTLFLKGADLTGMQREKFLEEHGTDTEVGDLLRRFLSVGESDGPAIFQACWLPSGSEDELTASPGRAFECGELLRGRFEIVGFVGEGGAGEVYRAYDHDQNIFVALKTLRRELHVKDAEADLLRNELNTARSVSHPGICRLHDAHLPVEDGERAFVSMELLEGETLAQRIRREGPLSLGEADRIVRQMIPALAAAHEKGVVHRDLKCGNVMLCIADRRVVIMDFGLARDISLTKAGGLESTAHFAGTPAYMPPERLRGKRAGYTADIYAFGVILFEMTTGRLPFEGGTAAEVVAARLSDAAPSPKRYRRDLDPRWVYLIKKCLEAEPGNRPQSFQEIERLLEQQPPVLWNRRGAILWGTLAAATATGIAGWVRSGRGKGIVTLEVYEFANQTGKAEFNYICIGMGNELARRISQLPWVLVVPMRATFSLAGARAASRKDSELSLAGFLQMEGSEPVLALKLQGREGRVAWEQKYSQSAWTNTAVLQSEVVGKVTATLAAALDSAGKGSGKATATEATRNGTAFDLYLRATYLLQEQSADSVSAAIQHLERAVSQDAHFALAYASLGEAYLALQNFGGRDIRTAELARGYAERAVREDPALAEAHAVLGAVRQLEWDWRGAESSYDEAIRIKRSFARAYRWRAGLKLQFARFDESLEDNSAARELDPYDRSAIAGNGLCLLFAGRTQAAAEFLQREIADRDLPAARYNLAQAYAVLGAHSGAAEADRYRQLGVAQAERIVAVEQRVPASKGELSAKAFGIVYAMQGDGKKVEPYLSRLTLLVEEGYTSPGTLAMILAPLGRLEEAMAAIQRSVDARDRFVQLLRVNVFLERLRGRTDFEAVLKATRLI